MEGKDEEGCLNGVLRAEEKKTHDEAMDAGCGLSSSPSSSPSRSSSSSRCVGGRIDLKDGSRLVGGWMEILPPSSLRRLREKADFYTSSISPDEANPLPIESVARVIARIVSQTKTLLISCPHISLEESFAAALRPFQRLSVSSLLQEEIPKKHEKERGKEEEKTPQEKEEGRSPTASLAATWCTYTSTMSEWEEERRLLYELLSTRIQETLHSSSLRDILLSEETLLYLRKALAVNCQAINLWGAGHTGDLMVLRAGGVYTLHSCFNHSCQPNCSVSSWGHRGGGAVLSIFSLREIRKGEELTHCYLDGACGVERRREILFQTYGFLCNCERCVAEGGLSSSKLS